jgi:hypothetical protein
MSDQTNFNSMEEILSHLQALATGNSGVPFEQFDQLRKRTSEATMTPSELNQLVNFASDQVGIWQSEWVFSSSDFPDTSAKAESEQWEKLWEVSSNMLIEQVPEIKEQNDQKHQLNILRCHMSQRLLYNNKKPFNKLISVCLSKISIALNNVGLKGIANHLYILALYPKGTVGRAGY